MDSVYREYIGKEITINIVFFVDGSAKDEYIQGILVDIDGDFLIINQHIPFCNLFEKDGKTVVARREIHIANIKNGIKTF